WHNPLCNFLELHSSGGIRRCLTCYSADVDPAAHGEATRWFKPIRQKTELRLLSVKAGNFGDVVHCWLIPCKLENRPTYEAISYTWADEFGDATKSREIYLNNSPLRVTVNCEAALRRVRLPERARTIWIDAVCINQEDQQERGHQVQLMPEIYAGARRVLIYLGEPTNVEYESVSYISDRLRFNQDDLKLCDEPTLSAIARRALCSLLSRRYFSRIWILQEVSLAKEATLIEFDKPRYREPSQLLELLDLARNSDAKDPRDKVFAVFGMINCAESLGYVADYKEETEGTYSRIAVQLSEAHGLMAILVRAA
ncbi:HET-domain-containing protein, partial [Parathielavia appendiculata]